jgi:dimethylsulfoniopropionate demethylase
MNDTPVLSLSRRTRRTPFTSRVEASGVNGFTVYNRMLLPTVFEGMEADYHHLKNHVQVWDVACERQVEIKGPDATPLVQFLTPRNLKKIKDDQCLYIPVVDNNGGMLNDPVAIKHTDNHWWISIADSDLLLWVKGVATGMKFDVTVKEPDVSPLGVQGPKSDQLMERVFGKTVRDIQFFRHAKLEFEGRRFTVARSGYSKQGGFEIYVDGGQYGEALWDALFKAGEDLNVKAGCPNLIERVEAGLLSYGNDMTVNSTPIQCGLGRFVSKIAARDCIGGSAILAELKSGPTRQIRSIAIDGDPLKPCRDPWSMSKNGKSVGKITSAVWSPDFKTNVAIGMVDKNHWEPGNTVEIQTFDGPRTGVVQATSFI